MSYIPYGSAASIDHTGGAVSCLDTAGKKASWVNIRNRSDSANSFDISWDGGSTYITRLNPGEAIAFGGFSRGLEPSMMVSTIFLQCSDNGGTATAELTCTSGGTL